MRNNKVLPNGQEMELPIAKPICDWCRKECKHWVVLNGGVASFFLSTFYKAFCSESCRTHYNNSKKKKPWKDNWSLKSLPLIGRTTVIKLLLKLLEFIRFTGHHQFMDWTHYCISARQTTFGKDYINTSTTKKELLGDNPIKLAGLQGCNRTLKTYWQ